VGGSLVDVVVVVVRQGEEEGVVEDFKQCYLFGYLSNLVAEQ